MSTNTASKMKSRGLTALAALCAFLALPDVAEAQEIHVTGPLAGAPAVRKLRLYRKGRVEVAPHASFTLLDEYQRHIMPGLKLNYHFTDWLGIGVWGAFGALKMPTGLSENIQEVNASRGCRDVPAGEQQSLDCRLTGVNMGRDFRDQLGSIDWIASPQITLVPFRGKLGLFNNVYADTDLYFFGGPAFVGLNERANCPGNCSDLSAFAMESRTAIAPSAGLGLTFYLSRWVALGWEYRGIAMSRNPGGLDTGGSGPDQAFPDNRIDENDRQFKINQIMSISVSLFFPTQYQISE